MQRHSLKLPALNEAIFAGRLAMFPERLASTGGVGARFSVTVISSRARRNVVTVIPCVAWGAIAETILTHLQIGAAVLISGALSSRDESKDVFVRVRSLQILDQDRADLSEDVPVNQ